MSIADKLVTIAENQSKVYDAGKLAVLKASRYMNATACGTVITVNDVSPIEHDIRVKVASKNLVDFSKFSFYGCVSNGDGTISANISNAMHCRIDTKTLNSFFMENLGKPFTFSITSESTADTRLLVVVYGTRTNGEPYQIINGIIGESSMTFAVSIDFTKISSVDFRMLGKLGRYSDSTSVISNIQVERGTTATPYTPYVEDFSQVIVKQYAVDSDDAVNYQAITDGTVYDVRSISPDMTLVTDTDGVTLTCSYLRDIDTYIDNLTVNVVMTGGD